jgi:[ribosomal protein S18]-alanine N-acetyltransferase
MATPRPTPSELTPNVTIDRMTEHDLLEVVEIEELSGLSPWGWDAYHKELQSREGTIMLVARELASYSGKTIAGFVVARIIVDELHVNNIAVRPEWRRKGIGEQLLNRALAWGQGQSANLALLEVRASNAAARALYQRCGFEVTGRRRRYYRTPLEDALIMTVSLR